MSNGKFINLWVGQEAPPNISDLWLYPSNSGYQFRKFNRNTAQWVTSASQTVSSAEDMPAIGKVLLNTGKCLSAGAAASFLEYCKERNLGVEAVGIITGTSLPSSSSYSSGLTQKKDIGDSIVASDGKGYFVIASDGVSAAMNSLTSAGLLNTLAAYPKYSSEVATPCELDSSTLLCLSGTTINGWTDQNGSQEVYKYSITSNSFTQAASNSILSVYKRTALIGNSLYVTGIYQIQKYNITSGTWSTVPNAPTTEEGIRSSININDKLYTLIKLNSLNLYEFNPTSNLWRFVTSYVNKLSVTHGITWNNRKFFAGGYSVQLAEILEDFSLAVLIDKDPDQPVLPVAFNDLLYMIGPNPDGDKSCKITPGSYEISPYNPETN